MAKANQVMNTAAVASIVNVSATDAPCTRLS
jgi:hypothetical protein